MPNLKAARSRTFERVTSEVCSERGVSWFHLQDVRSGYFFGADQRQGLCRVALRVSREKSVGSDKLCNRWCANLEVTVGMNPPPESVSAAFSLPTQANQL